MTPLLLDDILGGNRTLPSIVAGSETQWAHMKPWFDEMARWRKTKELNILNASLPTDFVLEVLNKSHLSFFETGDGTHLCSTSYSLDYKPISATDIFIKYGAKILEQVYEKGMVEITKHV